MSNWEKTVQYQRIMEILYDYWLSEPEEEEVYVRMLFLKSNGEYQGKVIRWKNPKYADREYRLKGE